MKTFCEYAAKRAFSMMTLIDAAFVIFIVPDIMSKFNMDMTYAIWLYILFSIKLFFMVCALKDREKLEDQLKEKDCK